MIRVVDGFRRATPLLVAAALATGSAACSHGAPPAPGMSSATPQTIAGNERIGWDQLAPDAVELETYHYAMYVDSQRVELPEAGCDPTFTATGYACSSPLPALSPGAHTLRIASYVVDGRTVLESNPSTPLFVSVAAAPAGAPVSTAGDPSPSDWANTTVAATGAAALRLELAASGLEHPTDLAFAPDGRVFVAEAAGRVRIVASGALASAPALVLDDVDADAGGLRGLALDPDFARTGFVYLVYASRTASGEPEFLLARFRAVQNTLAERAILLSGVRARRSAAAAVRVAPDGTLALALDDGADPAAAADLASPSGKVLRLNRDGTTPADQPAASPVFALPFSAPAGLARTGADAPLWVADDGPGDTARIVAVVKSAGGGRAIAAISYALPPGTHPTALAPAGAALGPAFRGNLLAATGEGRALLRLWIDGRDPTKVTGSERLLADRVGPVWTVATAPDGTTYFGTATALGRLVAAAAAPQPRTRP
jgi:aldose sugar dehydrogenase